MVYISKGHKKVKLVNALNGGIRNPLNEDEAKKVAINKLNVKAEITTIEYLTETGNHHEYRERPLPAYAITFGKPANTTVYISKEYGNVQTFRNNKWRVFDFLWMLHTMDYQGETTSTIGCSEHSRFSESSLFYQGLHFLLNIKND